MGSARSVSVVLIWVSGLYTSCLKRNEKLSKQLFNQPCRFEHIKFRPQVGRLLWAVRKQSVHQMNNPYRVTIAHDFFMLESEVTQEQYIELMNTNPSQNYQCGKECPVDSVTWNNVVVYANRLSRHQDYPVCYAKDGDRWVWIKGCLGWRLLQKRSGRGQP